MVARPHKQIMESGAVEVSVLHGQFCDQDFDLISRLHRMKMRGVMLQLVLYDTYPSR